MGEQLDDLRASAKYGGVTYRSIFLSPDWMYARYLGWNDRSTDPNFRILEQRRGPLRRTLVISDVENAAALERCWPGGASVTPLSELCFHDLRGSDDIAEYLTARGFRELGAKERLLNIATLAIDLSPDEEALFAALSSDTRRKVRKAENAGLRFVADAHSDEAHVAAFIAAFNAMAAERALQPLRADTIAAMIAGGHARLFAVIGDDGPQTFLLSYEADATGFFLSGAAVGRQNDGAGHLLQWGTIRALKAAGHGWYDMGGLASTDEANGIYRFKKGFGGILVPLGREFGSSGAVVRGARRLSRLRKGA